MSLINKMLKDLETRQNAPLGKPPSRPIFQDLHAVSEKGLQHRWLLVLLLAITTLIVAGAGYFWIQRHQEPSVLPMPANNEATANTASSSDAQPQPALTPAAPVEVTPKLVPATEPAPALETAPALPVLPPSPAVAPPLPASQTKVDVAPPVIAPPIPTVATAVLKPSKSRSVAPSKRIPPVAVAPQDGASDISANGSIEKKIIPLTPEQTAENTYRAAAQQLQQRQLIEAEAGFKSALATNPRHVAARELLAGLLLERGRMDEARQVLEQGLASVPGQNGFVSLLARIHVEQGAPDTAVTLLEQQRLAKPDAETLALLATLYQRSSRHTQAIAAYKDALTLKPQEGKWWVGLGISQEAMQNWAEARFAYERARDTNIDPRLARYAEQRLAIVRAK